MTKITSNPRRNKAFYDGMAALAFVRSGQTPLIAERQRCYRAEHQRISRGGEPPGGLDRDYALAWLRSLIRGNQDMLRRITRIVSGDDFVPLPAAQTADERQLIRQRPRQTEGPPPKQRRRLCRQTETPVDEQIQKSCSATSKKYPSRISGASAVSKAEDFCAARRRVP